MNTRPIRGLLLLCVVALSPLGCSTAATAPPADPAVPVVRVRLLQDVPAVKLTATRPPVVQAGADAPKRLNFPADATIDVALSPGGWRVGDVTLGAGVLTVNPGVDGSLSIDGSAYRGTYRLVPVRNGKFDVVNDVDVEAYLRSVVSKELLWGWAEETYKAQTIVARTYAIYELKTAGRNSHFDVDDDQRSQVYGGIAAESAKSRAGVDATRGIVVAWGPQPGQEKVFKAYFSSCCGGITQSAPDAFGPQGENIPPLWDQNARATCSASPKFNWGPVVVTKDELTRRFRMFAKRREQSMQHMAPLRSIEVHKQNRFGRPVRFLVTDAKGAAFSLGGEELRWAVNTDAKGGGFLYSSFFKIINDPDAVRFVEGHGWGHGVGMCQWCAQTRAEAGMRHEDIVLAAYPQAKLRKAY